MKHLNRQTALALETVYYDCRKTRYENALLRKIKFLEKAKELAKQADIINTQQKGAN